MAVSEATGERSARHTGERFGPYVLHEVLGSGAMAIVYRAESRKRDSLGEPRALKLLHPANDFDIDFDVIRSFIEEARLATRFDHVNIAKTFALGKVDGRYLIEMEYVAGKSLHRIARRSERAGAMPICVAIELLVQICDALVHVHELCDDTGRPLDLVHRDVSPSNIIVSTDGVAKLIDFGIVKGHSSKAPTEAGVIKGKIGYVAPEYLKGKIDHRADLFALGVIAHELLTSRRLFQASNELDAIRLVLGARIAPPSRQRPGVSAALDAIVMKAVEREPSRRWQSAREMREALLALPRRVTGPELVSGWVEQAFAPPLARGTTMQLERVFDSLERPTATVAVDVDAQLVSSEDVAPPAAEPAPRAERPPWLALCLVLAFAIALGLLGPGIHLS
jgi:serine/threonine-protein kinase